MDKIDYLDHDVFEFQSPDNLDEFFREKKHRIRSANPNRTKEHVNLERTQSFGKSQPSISMVDINLDKELIKHG